MMKFIMDSRYQRKPRSFVKENEKMLQNQNGYAFLQKLLKRWKTEKSEAKLTIGSCKREHETDVLSFIPYAFL